MQVFVLFVKPWCTLCLMSLQVVIDAAGQKVFCCYNL